MARVIQTQQKVAGTRRAALDEKLVKLLEDVAARNNVYFEVYSGGQNDETGYTGSVRHDHGNAADLKAYQIDEAGNKKYITTDTRGGQALWKNIASSSIALGATGVGMAEGYMGNGSMHIGFGNPANHGRPSSTKSTIVWGDGGKSATAPDWLVSARNEGLGFRGKGLPTPPGNIPGVATSLDIGTGGPPTPMPGRPPALGGRAPTAPELFGASVGDMESPLARLATTTLGWKDDTLSSDGMDVRTAMDPLTRARSRIRATLPGGVPDEQMMGMTQPQQESIPLPRSRPPVAPMPMPGRPAALTPPTANKIGPGPNWDVLNTLKAVSAGAYEAPPAVMPMPGRPPSLNASPTPPTPMPGRPVGPNGTLPSPAVTSAPPQAPAPKLLRLPSGGMIAPGTYDNAASGIPYTVTEGPNGTAIIQSQRAGLVDLGKEVNAPTVLGGIIRSKIPEVAQTAVQNFAPAMDNVKNTAANAINTAVPMVQGLGSSISGTVGGLFGGLFGGAPAGPQYQPGMMGRGLPARQAPSPLMPSQMLRAIPKVPPPRAQTRAERFTNLDAFGNII